MSTSYPGALDSFVNPTATDTLDSATVPHAAQHDNINDAMAAVQVTLGVNPQGGSATVVARLTAIESSVSGKAATNQTMYVGTTALAINRSSASQTLTGVNIDGNAATVTNGVTTATTSLPNVTSVNSTTIPASATLVTAATTSLPNVTSVNSTTIPASATLVTTATTSLPNVTSVNSTTIPASATLLTSASTSSALTSFGTDPTANTQAVDNSSTKIATTAFVLGQAASATPANNGTAAVGTSTRYARADHVHNSDSTKANLSGATFTGQTSVQSTSTSAVPMIVKPAGSLTITGLTASHAGGSGQSYDTIGGFSSTVGLVAGQSVVMSGFSNANFNNVTPTTTTITLVSATTIRVTSLNNTDGTGTGGQIVVTGATQQNLQEWQYNNGTAVASVSASGIVTASSFSGSVNGSNLTDATVTAAKLASAATAPTLWYSPTSNYTKSSISATTPFDPFGLSNGVIVGLNKTYSVDYLISGTISNTTASSASLRLTIAGDAVGNFNFITHQSGFISSSSNGNWLSTNDFGAFINGTTANWQIGGTIAGSATTQVFQIRLTGVLRTASSGQYFQPQLSLSAVNGTSMTINRESFASLVELGSSSTTQLGTWS
jgi:hypothetical protein